VHKYEVQPSMIITEAAEEMVAVASSRDEPVQGTFNGHDLIAYPGDSAAAIEAAYRLQIDAQKQEYMKSAAGKLAVAARLRRRFAAQDEVDALMKELPNLDFADLTSVINWIDRLIDPSDFVGVDVPVATIVSTFLENGFKPNTVELHDFDDRNNFARHLIGHGINGIITGQPGHGIFHQYANNWREKFNIPANSPNPPRAISNAQLVLLTSGALAFYIKLNQWSG
jgi:hypothetical protein